MLINSDKIGISFLKIFILEFIALGGIFALLVWL